MSVLPECFIAINSTEILGIPISAFYVLIVAIVMWLLEHTPTGRCMYAVGGNPTAAYLNGISIKEIYDYAIYCI